MDIIQKRSPEDQKIFNFRYSIGYSEFKVDLNDYALVLKSMLLAALRDKRGRNQTLINNIAHRLAETQTNHC